jgi:hypothetical protein
MKRQHLKAGFVLAGLMIWGIAGSISAGEQVPFKGILEGSFTAIADLPPANNRFLDAEGEATLLGHFTYDFPHSVDRSMTPATGVGCSIFTAANGDEVHAYIEGEAELFEVVNGIVILLGVEEGLILGGTGRFENASGSFVITRFIDTGNLTTIGSFEGTISSPASN